MHARLTSATILIGDTMSGITKVYVNFDIYQEWQVHCQVSFPGRSPCTPVPPTAGKTNTHWGENITCGSSNPPLKTNTKGRKRNSLDCCGNYCYWGENFRSLSGPPNPSLKTNTWRKENILWSFVEQLLFDIMRSFRCEPFLLSAKRCNAMVEQKTKVFIAPRNFPPPRQAEISHKISGIMQYFSDILTVFLKCLYQNILT